MDIIEIERGLTGYMATKLTLEVDKTIFRGGIPAIIPEGVGCVLGDEIKGAGFRARTWNFHVFGKYCDRDAAMRLATKVYDLLPDSFTLSNGTKVLSLSARGSSAVYHAIDNGDRKWNASINLVVVIATSGTQI